MRSKVEKWAVIFMFFCISIAFLVFAWEIYQQATPYEYAKALNEQNKTLERHRKAINQIIAYEKYKFRQLDTHRHTRKGIIYETEFPTK